MSALIGPAVFIWTMLYLADRKVRTLPVQVALCIIALAVLFA